MAKCFKITAFDQQQIFSFKTKNVTKLPMQFHH